MSKRKALGYIGQVKNSVDEILKFLNGRRAGATLDECLTEAQLLIGYAKHLEHEIWLCGKYNRKK